MRYRLPQSSSIVRYVLSEYEPTDIIVVSQALYAFYRELESALKIAHLNDESSEEYIKYLHYFKSYIRISHRNKDSVLRTRLEEANKLRQLQQIL